MGGRRSASPVCGASTFFEATKKPAAEQFFGPPTSSSKRHPGMHGQRPQLEQTSNYLKNLAKIKAPAFLIKARF